VADGWLGRSGQAWKTRTAVFGAVAGVMLVLLALTLGRLLDRRLGALVPLSLVIAFPLLLLNFLLPMLVRCRICGLQMDSSSAVRELPRDQRLAWLETLQACPICGDDGLASSESRERWLAGGMPVERPYWSLTRILLATLVTVLLAGGGMWIGVRYRVR
jgi:hypothetical protein